MTQSDARATVPVPAPGPEAAALYLDLLKGALTRLWFDDGHIVRVGDTGRRHRRRVSPAYGEQSGYDRAEREVGLDWPAHAETMIGIKRLDALQRCVETVLADGVNGDLVETGVWRGGATIFMRGILRAFGVTDRKVYVADSFGGVPPPDVERYPADEGLDLHLWPGLAVSVGGFVVVDDYALEGCRAAVDDFRKTHGIADEIVEDDWTGVHWRRSR